LAAARDVAIDLTQRHFDRGRRIKWVIERSDETMADWWDVGAGAPPSSGPWIGVSAEYRGGDQATGRSPIRSDFVAKEPLGSAVKARSLRERAWPIAWCRHLLEVSIETAIVAFQERYSDGQKYWRHHHRGGAATGVREAESGARRGEWRSQKIRRASPFVLVRVFVLTVLGLAPAHADG
jgi:hypothetical protein